MAQLIFSRLSSQITNDITKSYMPWHQIKYWISEINNFAVVFIAVSSLSMQKIFVFNLEPFKLVLHVCISVAIQRRLLLQSISWFKLE